MIQKNIMDRKFDAIKNLLDAEIKGEIDYIKDWEVIQ